MVGVSHAKEVSGFGNAMAELDMVSTWMNECEDRIFNTTAGAVLKVNM